MRTIQVSHKGNENVFHVTINDEGVNPVALVYVLLKKSLTVS